MFSTIELFAGAGGLALGIEKAGFNTLACLEFDKDACDTLRKNRPKWRVIEDDIANISCLDLENYFSLKKGELDLLSGGAPCQAFSYAGKNWDWKMREGRCFTTTQLSWKSSNRRCFCLRMFEVFSRMTEGERIKLLPPYLNRQGILFERRC